MQENGPNNTISKGKLWQSIVLTIILLIFPIILGITSLGMSLGCGLGGIEDFQCRTVPPLATLGFLLSIPCIIFIVKNVNSGKRIWPAVIILSISFALPMLLLLLTNTDFETIRNRSKLPDNYDSEATHSNFNSSLYK